jgi:formamidopyrimidine-DNA glycosylase
VSIELPEAKILADQMDRELRKKRIRSYHLQEHERLQRIGFLNRDLKAFDQLVDGEVESVTSRGNAIRMKLSNNMNLLLNPEYGTKTLYHAKKADVPQKFHLKVEFSDGSAMTVRLTSMGGVYALRNSELPQSYIFRRDFNPQIAAPLDEELTAERFANLLAANSRSLKSVLVGKDAVVVGLSNSAFQDIIYRARLHPKRKTSTLTKSERRALYDAIQLVLRERLRLHGKTQFSDFYGTPGGYTAAMGPHLKQRTCPACGTPIEKLSVGGGHVYYCPTCQV